MENIIKDLIKVFNKNVFEVKGIKEFPRSKIESLFKNKLKNIYNSSFYSYSSSYFGDFVLITCYSKMFPDLEFWFKEKEYEEEEFNQLASLKLGNEYIIPSNKKLFQFSYLKINKKVINNEEEATEILLNLLSFKLETEANEAKKIYKEKIKLLDEIKKIKSSLK